MGIRNAFQWCDLVYLAHETVRKADLQYLPIECSRQFIHKRSNGSIFSNNYAVHSMGFDAGTHRHAIYRRKHRMHVKGVFVCAVANLS
jgi:hypothetical protein